MAAANNDILVLLLLFGLGFDVGGGGGGMNGRGNEVVANACGQLMFFCDCVVKLANS